MTITDTSKFPPKPSRACMDILLGRDNDPAALAEFRTAYRAEITAAGFDPDYGTYEPHTPAPTASPLRGQGKDYALPPSDR